MEKNIKSNQAPEKPVDPMKLMVPVTLQRATGKDEKFVFVALNGKGYTIRKGQTVRVPAPVADILEESLRQSTRAEDFSEGIIAAAQEKFAKLASGIV